MVTLARERFDASNANGNQGNLLSALCSKLSQLKITISSVQCYRVALIALTPVNAGHAAFVRYALPSPRSAHSHSGRALTHSTAPFAFLYVRMENELSVTLSRTSYEHKQLCSRESNTASSAHTTHSCRIRTESRERQLSEFLRGRAETSIMEKSEQFTYALLSCVSHSHRDRAEARAEAWCLLI